MVTETQTLIAGIALGIGLIHGTYDWLLLPKRLDLIKTSLLYFVLLWPYLAIWILSPKMGVVIFLILTAYHWGQEELYATIKHLNSDVKRKGIFIMGKGGMTVVFPLAIYHEDYSIVVNHIISFLGDDTGFELLFNPYTRYSLILIVSACLVIYTIEILREGHHKGEIILTSFYSVWFLLAPIFLSIPVYLAVRHSGIHMERVHSMKKRGFKLYIKDSAPYLIGSLLIFIIGIVLVQQSFESVQNIVSIYLVYLSLLTLPHAVITTLLDIEQGVLP